MFVVRFFIAVVSMCAGSVPAVHGQRVYADTPQSSTTQTVPVLGTILSEVTSPFEAVDGDDNVPANLFVKVGALGLVSASLNAQFTTAKPTSKSPVIVKLTAIIPGTSILSLLGSVLVQTTNNNGNAITSTSMSDLLSLLGISLSFTSGDVITVVLPAPNQTYDGVKLRISSVLAVDINAKYYYAFFVTPPTINNATVCSGQGALLSVTNVQSGYQYKWYAQETGGTALATTTGGAYTTMAITSATSYYVEAMDSGLYPSARTRVDISVLPKPSTPMVHLNN